MYCNQCPYGDGPDDIIQELLWQVWEMDVFGPCEEDVSLLSVPGFLPYGSSANVRITIQHGTSKDEIVADLRAALKRAESENWD